MEVNNGIKSKISVDVNEARMPFDQFYSGGSDLCLSSYKFQNDYIEESGQVSETFTPDFSFYDEQQSPSYNSWAMKDKSYQLMDCAQSTPKNRDLKDAYDFGSEADLYGLVSNILEEADPMDSYVSEEISSGLTTGWSPKSRENSLQYLNSEVKVQSSSGMQHNPEHGFKLHTFPVETDFDQNSDVLPHFSGSEAADSSWLYSPCSGDSEYESYVPAFPNLPRPPPGLDISHVVRSHFSRSGPGKLENNVSVKESSFYGISDEISESVDTFNDHHSIPNKMNDSFFSPFQNFSELSGLRIGKNNSQQCSMQDASKLANSLEALLMGEQQDVYNRGSAQCNAMKVQDENMIDLKGLPLQWMSAFEAPIAGSKREITMEQRDGEVGNITPKEFADFGQQSADYFEASKPFSSSSYFLTHQSREANQRSTINLPNSLHQYHCGQSNPHHCYTKPPPKTSISTDPLGMSQSVTDFASELPQQQMQRTGSRAFSDFGQRGGRTGCMDLRLGLKGIGRIGGTVDKEAFDLKSETGRLQTPSATGLMTNAHPSSHFGAKPKSLAGFPKETNKKKGLLPNPCQILGNMYAGQVRHNGAKPAPSQTFPSLYQMGVVGKNLSHIVPSQSPLTYSGSLPVPDVSELWPDAELPALNPYLQEMMEPNLAGVNGPFPGLISSLRSSNQSMSQLHYHLEDCYEQWRLLKNERKKAEALLLKNFPDKYVSVMNTNPAPKLPPKPTRVDRLIVDQFQEQAKVVSLLGMIERLRSFPLHANIISTLDRHLEAICITQARRKEFLNSSRQRPGLANLREDKDILLLASALRDLSKSTRLSCTTLWCALQMTMPKISNSTEDGEEGNTSSVLEEDSSDQIAVEKVP